PRRVARGLGLCPLAGLPHERPKSSTPNSNRNAPIVDAHQIISLPRGVGENAAGQIVRLPCCTSPTSLGLFGAFTHNGNVICQRPFPSLCTARPFEQFVIGD